MATVWQPELLRTQQIGECTGILRGAPAHLTFGNQLLGENQVSRCGIVRNPAFPVWREGVGGKRFSRVGHRKEQEHLWLWPQCLLDHSICWDNSLYRKSSRSADFRRKGSGGEVLRLNIGAVNGVMPAETVIRSCQQGKLTEAVGALEYLAQAGCPISTSLFYSVIKQCTAKKDLLLGRRVHELTTKLGYESNAYLGNHLLRMYASGGRLQEAMDVFTKVRKPDAFMWSSMMSACAKHGKPREAIQLYREMRCSAVKADAHVFAAALQACALAKDLESGRKVHCDVLGSGISFTMFVGTCLVDMYAKCGELEAARQVFDSLATKNVVTCNALIAGYANIGDLNGARRVFDSLAAKDVVTWTALIAGYVKHDLAQEALGLYREMEQEGITVADGVVLACLLKACGMAGALQKGRQLHSQIVQRGLLDNVLVGTCLVDMYAKCGELAEARRVFNSLATKDVVSWTTLISGYGACDDGHNALACFEEMLVSGIRPDEATFTCLLVACSHEGLVHEGRKHFDSMADRHSIQPTIEHYNCMIDLLGRAGHLDEAEQMLFSCEDQSNVVGLTSLLNSCKSHGDIERAARCFESLVRLDPQRASTYVLMANAYADAGRWTDVERIEAQRMIAGANKKPAVAGIELKEQVHTFVVGERTDDIALKVEGTNARLRQEGGHIPQTELVLKPLLEKEKEDVLCGHAEKLALAFGLLNTPRGTPLMVTKNLRMCSDCHSSTEIMSRIERREIVVRDGYRVHRFASGCCSCKGRP